MFKFSLIVATFGRLNELKIFLDSLICQSLACSDFEVFIIDQNTDGLIDSLISDYKKNLQIQHIKSEKKGLSFNRNIGIMASSGHYVCVPDDDCIYYPDTLQKAWEEIVKFDSPDMIIGKVFDRKSNKHVFKKTPLKSEPITQKNFYQITTSITLFFKKNEIRFDEEFGVGSKYYANEDGDIILSFIAQNKRVMYSPNIECNHPPYNANNTTKEKLYNYGIGFGAMCKKHLSAELFFLFLKVVVFQILMLLLAIAKLNKIDATRRWYSLKGRWNGYFLFSKSAATIL